MHRIKKSALHAISGILISTALTTQSYGIGGNSFGNEVLSARALGQGNVGVAGINDDLAVVYANPAALTRLKGTQLTLGSTWENLKGTYEPSNDAEVKTRTTNALVPNFVLSHSMMDGRLGAGIGMFSPYGLETHWPGDSSLRYIATNSRIRMLMVSPAVAYKVGPIGSIGFGLDYVNAFTNELEKNINVNNLNNLILLQSGFTPTASGAPDAVSKLTGTDTSWGYHAGLTLEPHEKHRIGLTYHSKIKMHITGRERLTGLSGLVAGVFGGENYETSATTDYYLPQNLQLGYAYIATERLSIEADTAWYDWTSNRDLNVRFAETDPTRLAILTNSGNGNPLRSDWRAAWSAATGVNYKYSVRTQLRAGFWYIPWAAPESTFNPAFLDLTRYGVTLGTGHQLAERWRLDLAYNAIFFHHRHIANNLGANTTGDASTNLNGVFKDFVNLVAVNLTYAFR